MHIRLTRGRFDPGRYDDVRRISEESVEAGKQLAGCRSHQLSIDRASGRVLALSTWDNPEQAAAIGQLRPPFEAIGVQFEAPELYEVVAQR